MVRSKFCVSKRSITTHSIGKTVLPHSSYSIQNHQFVPLCIVHFAEHRRSVVFFWLKRFAPHLRASCEEAMASKRLVAPKEIRTVDLQVVLDMWMGKKGSRDLEALTAELRSGVSWKSAPKAATLAAYADLYVAFAKISPTGMLPAKKLALDLCASHKQRPCNFSGKPEDVWSDTASGLLRAGFQKYREIAKDAEAHRRCMGKVPLTFSVSAGPTVQ